MKIYLACALTHVPRSHFSEYAGSLHHIASELAHRFGHEVKYALVNSDPHLASKPSHERARLCYAWDRTMVQEAEAVVAECSFPSIGLGIELEIAAEHKIPVVLIFRDYRDNCAEPVLYVNPDQSKHELQIGEGFVSLMALGLPNVIQVYRYSNNEDALRLVGESLHNVKGSDC